MWIPLRSAKMYGLHLGVPAAGLVAEVDAGLEQLAHRDGGHGVTSCGCASADPRRGAVGRASWPVAAGTVPLGIVIRVCAPCRPVPDGRGDRRGPSAAAGSVAQGPPRPARRRRPRSGPDAAVVADRRPPVRARVDRDEVDAQRQPRQRRAVGERAGLEQRADRPAERQPLAVVERLLGQPEVPPAAPAHLDDDQRRAAGRDRSRRGPARRGPRRTFRARIVQPRRVEARPATSGLARRRRSAGPRVRRSLAASTDACPAAPSPPLIGRSPPLTPGSVRYARGPSRRRYSSMRLVESPCAGTMSTVCCGPTPRTRGARRRTRPTRPRPRAASRRMMPVRPSAMSFEISLMSSFLRPLSLTAAATAPIAAPPTTAPRPIGPDERREDHAGAAAERAPPRPAPGSFDLSLVIVSLPPGALWTIAQSSTVIAFFAMPPLITSRTVGGDHLLGEAEEDEARALRLAHRAVLRLAPGWPAVRDCARARVPRHGCASGDGRG